METCEIPQAEECRERQSLALEEFRNLDLQAGVVRLEHVVEEERAKIIPLFHGTNEKKLQKWSPTQRSSYPQKKHCFLSSSVLAACCSASL